MIKKNSNLEFGIKKMMKSMVEFAQHHEIREGCFYNLEKAKENKIILKVPEQNVKQPGVSIF